MTGLRGTPGSRAVVRISPPGKHPHVFLIVHDDTDPANGRLRIVDLKRPDTYDHEVATNALTDRYLRDLYLPSTTIAVFDGDGNPTTTSALAAATPAPPAPRQSPPTRAPSMLPGLLHPALGRPRGAWSTPDLSGQLAEQPPSRRRDDAVASSSAQPLSAAGTAAAGADLIGRPDRHRLMLAGPGSRRWRGVTGVGWCICMGKGMWCC